MNQKENRIYSVLMSVYRKEKPDHLRLAMESMLRQTVPPEEFILICDGPLTAELDAVIEEMAAKAPCLRVIRLEKNQGLGHALRLGMESCSCELVARMDSDDISLPDRCEKELTYLAAHPEISVVGGWIGEFSASPDQIQSIRQVPENADEILAFAKKRNPFNHPSVMLRKRDVLAAGNYQEVRYLQDYYLWAAMLAKGYQGHNLQEILVHMRADENLFKRRSGREYIRIQTNLFKWMREKGMITRREYWTSCAIRTLSGFAPNGLRQLVFKRVLRKT